MKWLIIQSDGEHKGQDGWCPNWHLRECYALREALARNGHGSDIWGLRHTDFARQPDFNSYDAILIIENYELSWLPDLAGVKTKKFYWLIDAHWQPAEKFDQVIHGCDVVLHSTRKFIKPYKERFPKQTHLYFPNGVDDRYFDRTKWVNPARGSDLIFIGGKAAPRADAIDRMVRECGLVYSYGVTGVDYICALLNAKMQFNKGLGGDINYRNWETIGLGACLLTEHDPEMEALGFKHGINCLFYKTLDEAVLLARQCLSSGDWRWIADSGYWFSLENTCAHRVKKLLHEYNP